MEALPMGFEELPLELVGLILSHVDKLTLPCCFAVCHSWTTALNQHRRAHPTAEPLVGKDDYCRCLAKEGQLAMLKWGHANGCPWDAWTCAWAARGGHLEVLQWARANGCPWDENTCSFAAGGGHLEVLQWARANGCPWDAWTGYWAARGGYLEVLQWARANSCPGTRDTPLK